MIFRKKDHLLTRTVFWIIGLSLAIYGLQLFYVSGDLIEGIVAGWVGLAFLGFSNA